MVHKNPLHQPYHDHEHGVFPQTDDELFARFCYEIFEAGLSWILVLKKREGLDTAFYNFSIDLIAQFNADDVERLMNDGNIIRQRAKIVAIIENARRIKKLQTVHGSWKNWLVQSFGITREEWIKIFKTHFVFAGPTITSEFLMGINFIEGGHSPSCPCFKPLERPLL